MVLDRRVLPVKIVAVFIVGGPMKGITKNDFLFEGFIRTPSIHYISIYFWSVHANRWDKSPNRCGSLNLAFML